MFAKITEHGVELEDEKARCPAHGYTLKFPIDCGNCNALEYARLKAHWDEGEAVIAHKRKEDFGWTETS